MSLSEARNYQTSIPQRSRHTEQYQQPKKLIKIKSRGITPGEKILVCLFGVCLSLALAFMVSYSANIDSLNRDLQKLEREVSEQQTINENLKHQVMEYSNPERILKIAKENGLDIQNTQVKQARQIVE
ncbi:cell division protein FtsL [Amphibacillus sp. MSJ-3]|uniref:cell division protein FtsL n=1 Tax=Amphibacillus sp. MSJ-3 TaxID=2841505 RepID=UPI001C0E97A5|nr:cell division protein FtsL [Amphibacillus sp. MSJ-3]MBU5595392.1 cell division protein FtsL [Amphibacillus sp. MSJ-3]